MIHGVPGARVMLMWYRRAPVAFVGIQRLFGDLGLILCWNSLAISFNNVLLFQGLCLMAYLFSQLEVQFIITGTNHHSEKEFCSYLQYLEYLSQNRPPPNAYELFAKGYEDYLQSPLQVGLECTKRMEVGGGNVS